MAQPFPPGHGSEDEQVCLLQDVSSAHPALLRALTAACQNDYNCKAAAKQGAAELAAGLLSSISSDAVFEAVCLLYTLTTQAEARLAVGKALVKTSSPQEASAVGQLFVLLASPNPGEYVCSQLEYNRTVAERLTRGVWFEMTQDICKAQLQTKKYSRYRMIQFLPASASLHHMIHFLLASTSLYQMIQSLAASISLYCCK